MLQLEQALARIIESIQPLPVETVSLSAGDNRIAAETVTAGLDIPPFDNSAMDGYAVRAADLASASAESPVALRLAGHLPAGSPADAPISPGQCARIFTGSPLPAGADAVVMQEDVRTDNSHSETILVLDAVKPWENIRFKGEDVKKGDRVLEPGEHLGATRLGLLAAVGVSELHVHRQPVVALLATGSELVEPGHPLSPGQIYESNRTALAPLIRAAGAIPRSYPIVPDTLAATRSALTTAFDECDVVITTGGASVGELDWVKKAFADLGGEMGFWKVAIKPGKPFIFGRRRDRLFFGLPGNPVSAFVTCFLLVRPALLRLQNASDLAPPSTPGILAEPFTNRGDRRHFARVTMDHRGQVSSAGGQSSHHLHSLAAADGLMDMAAGATLPTGTVVSVLRWA